MTSREPGGSVVVIGGPAGTGKTTLARGLSDRLGLLMCAVDDLHLAVQSMTTPQQQRELHAWRTHPDAYSLAPAEIVELHIAATRALAPALRAVIGEHVAERNPVIVEGDYLLPELLDPPAPWGPADGAVRAVFLDEPDAALIVGNFAQREPETAEQHGRAEVSRLLGARMRGQCAERGIPVLQPRPYETLLERALTALG